MSTAIISAEIDAEFLPTFKVLLKQFKAKSIKIEEKDTTKMSKEEFKTMLDNAEKTKSEVIVNSKEALSHLFKTTI